MADDVPFSDLVRRVRAGDGAAAAELVRRYEPALRVAVRVRLTDPALRRVLDSMDVCQSVLANFFVRAVAGQFDLDRPEQLLALLAAMARNKVTNLALKERAARHGGGRTRVGLGDADRAPAARGPRPWPRTFPSPTSSGWCGPGTRRPPPSWSAATSRPCGWPSASA